MGIAAWLQGAQTSPGRHSQACAIVPNISPNINPSEKHVFRHTPGPLLPALQVLGVFLTKSVGMQVWPFAQDSCSTFA